MLNYPANFEEWLKGNITVDLREPNNPARMTQGYNGRVKELGY